MKKHIDTSIGKSVRALALLALCAAATTGCKDEYELDDAKPTWLGESVLQSLRDRGVFNNYLLLMHDLGMDEILARTGSRTLFAAPDTAFQSFYYRNSLRPETDPWHTATSYAALSPSQKLLLAKCSMLNNAITMETLANSDGDVERGQYMRRNTLVSYTDSISYLAPDQLPISYNPNDDDQWKELRETGAYLTDGDGTSNMMLFFTAEHMANNNMVSSDIELVTGESRTPTDVHVYDSKIEEQDITAQNGYINMMHKVIAPLPNMAEVIRTNGETYIFSHILDRFSVPVYIEEYNVGYRNLHEDFTGKIYSKWYISEKSGLSKYIRRSASDKNVRIIPTGPEETDVRNLVVETDCELKFDPSWNALNTSGNSVYGDMAAMFVPDDETLLRAFKNGGRLYNLIETYAEPEQVAAVEGATLTNLQPLYEAIDMIPMSTIQALVKNTMQETFVGSVQSKFGGVKTYDATEDLFPGGECEVKNVKLACNGAVYVTSAIYAPSDYVSVAAPAFISKDKKVVRWAIYNGSTTGTDYMTINYYAYLKAMTSRFTFFLPNDKAMEYYYDTSSFKAKHPRLIKFSFKDATFPIKADAYNYSDTTGEVGKFMPNESLDQTDITGRLRDLLESHTIVHDDEETMLGPTTSGGVVEKDKYYLTKGGTAVKVVRDPNGNVVQVLGGFQIDNMNRGISAAGENTGVDVCNVLSSSLYSKGGNGETYVLDAPIIPTSRSVYSVMGAHDEFSRFFELCTNVDDDIIDDIGLKASATTPAQKKQMEKRYNVFFNDFGLDLNVAFFNNYNYTVYVPSNEAVDRAISEGLPTWEDIRVDFDKAVKDTILEAKTDKAGNVTYEKTDNWTFNDKNDSVRIAAKIQYLFSFIRLHFQDQSIFADQTARKTVECSTSCFFSPTGRDIDGNFLKTEVKRMGGQVMTVQAMNSRGELVGSPVNIIGTDEITKNVMARDISIVDKSGKSVTPVNVNTMNNKCIGSSSAAVVHLVDGVLRIDERFPDWNNPAEVRAVARHMQLKNKD